MGQENESILCEPSLQELGLQGEKRPTVIPNMSIPEVDENWGNKLWESVNKSWEKADEKLEKPPLDEIDLDQKTLALELRSKYGDKGSDRRNLRRARPTRLNMKLNRKQRRFHLKSFLHLQI